MLERKRGESGKVGWCPRSPQDPNRQENFVVRSSNDVLDHVEIEAGKKWVCIWRISTPGTVIDEMAKHLQPACRERRNGNTIRLHVAKNLGAMACRCHQSQADLFNLLSKRLQLYRSRAQSRERRISRFEGRDWIRFPRLHDTGIWNHTKQKETCSRVLPADASISRKLIPHPGIGGLPILASCVNEGRISVESEPGKGATSRCTCRPGRSGNSESARSTANSELAPASDESKARKDTILVIDDDASVRDLMSRF